jgi:hypothetical protein
MEYNFPNNWTDKQYFIYACFIDDLQLFYKQYIEQGKRQGRIQKFNLDVNGNYVHKYWCPSNICCESNDVLTINNIDIKVTYWTPFVWKPIKKELKQLATKKEAYECQLIDCSCNDCKNLLRNIDIANVGKFNICTLNKPVDVTPNVCNPNNTNCFVHRKQI